MLKNRGSTHPAEQAAREKAEREQSARRSNRAKAREYDSKVRSTTFRSAGAEEEHIWLNNEFQRAESHRG